MANPTRPISFVRLDIARLGIEISDRAHSDTELAAWAKSFHRALALKKPEINEYAAELLAEAVEFREKDKTRKAGNPPESSGIPRTPTEGAGIPPQTGIHSGTSIPSGDSPAASLRDNNLGDQDSERAPRLPAKPRKSSTTRPPDPLWDTLCEVFGLKPVTKAEQTRIGKVVSTLRKKEATPEKIRLVYAGMERNGWTPFSPEGLEKWYDQLSAPKLNGHAAAAPTYVPGFR